MITTAMTELPEDIIKHAILTRLPPKSLVRFMLVHKSWKALISSSVFVKSHLIQQESYKDQEHLTAGNSGFRVGARIISRSADAQAITGPSNLGLLIGSINGLVCMASPVNEFCIWNPAIGQLKEIYLPGYKHVTQRLIGFSWDHKQNDYKVVIVHSNTPTSMKLSIYSSNSSSWTEVLIPDSVVPESDRSILDCFSLIPPCTIVKGVPYRSCPKYNNSSLQRIYVFKFVAETNEFRSLPNLYSVVLQGKDFNFVNIRDRLSVLVYSTKQQYSLVDMYFLDEKPSDGVWSKMYSIGPIDLCNGYPFCFKNSGEILIDRCWGEFIYDGKKVWKFVDSRQDIRVVCYCYTPSLVRVEGMQFDADIIQDDKRTLPWSIRLTTGCNCDFLIYVFNILIRSRSGNYISFRLI